MQKQFDLAINCGDDFYSIKTYDQGEILLS